MPSTERVLRHTEGDVPQVGLGTFLPTTGESLQVSEEGVWSRVGLHLAGCPGGAALSEHLQALPY